MSDNVSDIGPLFAAYQLRLFRYLYRLVGHPDDARDLTQDVFVRVARAGAPPTGDSERRAWLFRIAHNLAIDHHRQRSRAPEAAVADEAPGRRATQETSVAVRRALAELAPLDRNVFLMKEVAGLSYAEIAAASDLSPDAVRSRLHRARLDLRRHLSSSIEARRTKPLRQGVRPT